MLTFLPRTIVHSATVMKNWNFNNENLGHVVENVEIELWCIYKLWNANECVFLYQCEMNSHDMMIMFVFDKQNNNL
jgi:hypothetical protein